MKRLTFLVLLDPSESGYAIRFVDFPDMCADAPDLESARQTSHDLLCDYAWKQFQAKKPLPVPAKEVDIKEAAGCLILPVTLCPHVVFSQMKHRRVKTNTTIPAWLKEAGEAQNINFSRLLEDALKYVLGIED